MSDVDIQCGDCVELMRKMVSESVNCCVTSPPYFGLRDYGNDGQIGLESTPEEFVSKMVDVFHEVHRVLRDDGTLWLNLSDSYSGSGKGAWSKKDVQKECYVPDPKSEQSNTYRGLPSKNLIGIPWRVALALQGYGWILRDAIIWHKPNPMPESVTDRCTRCYETIFMFSKKPKYYFDQESIKEPCTSTDSSCRDRDRTRLNNTPGRTGMNGLKTNHYETRNKRNVWSITTASSKDAHFAVFPKKLIEPCILAGCPVGGTVLDPFGGSGTTGVVALENARNAVLCELNPDYVELIKSRISGVQLPLMESEA